MKSIIFSIAVLQLIAHDSVHCGFFIPGLTHPIRAQCEVVWNWPWYLALLFAAPGLALIAPGVLALILSTFKLR